MRILAKALLVLFVMVGLTLPKTMARAHQVPCDSPDTCAEFVLTDCSQSLPCHDCPPPDQCPCDHEDLDEESPGEPLPDGDQCPSPSHQHHHHHQCVCSVANSWLISDSDNLALHPPVDGIILDAPEDFFAPESPVYLLDRPPMA